MFDDVAEMRRRAEDGNATRLRERVQFLERQIESREQHIAQLIAESTERERQLRLCDYCHAWKERPCGSGCLWDARGQTVEEHIKAARLERLQCINSPERAALRGLVDDWMRNDPDGDVMVLAERVVQFALAQPSTTPREEG